MTLSNLKRYVFVIGITTFLLTLLYLQSKHSPSWRAMPQAVGLGDVLSDERETRDDPNTAVNDRLKEKIYPSSGGDLGISTADAFVSTFVPGNAKPPGSNYTRNLVIAKTKKEEAGWLDHEDIGDVTKMVYVVDDGHSPLHPPMNKGHEVMVYLTYIIDHYDDLPDVSIFMHSHQYSWHENDLLGYDAAETIKRLSSERVQREGYMNLRCHWMPGCPDWMHPGTVEEDPSKKEETVMAQAWAELFPGRSTPAVLAQPCCAQFALSGQRVRAVSRDQYLFYREWLIRTKLEDKISGRVWEYLWQVVFTGEAKFCPNQWSCYCDGYGVCFEDEGAFDYWFELRYDMQKLEEELTTWRGKAGKVEKYRQEGRLTESSNLEIPEAGKDVELEHEIARLQSVMEDGRQRAIERGNDPQVRAKSAGRSWRPGDGF